MNKPTAQKCLALPDGLQSSASRTAVGTLHRHTQHERIKIGCPVYGLRPSLFRDVTHAP